MQTRIIITKGSYREDHWTNTRVFNKSGDFKDLNGGYYGSVDNTPVKREKDYKGFKYFFTIAHNDYWSGQDIDLLGYKFGNMEAALDALIEVRMSRTSDGNTYFIKTHIVEEGVLKDLAIELDSCQLQAIIEKLESYDFKVEGNNFYVGMGRRAADEIPRILGKLESLLSVSNQICKSSGRIENTSKIVLSGETMMRLNIILKQMGD